MRFDVVTIFPEPVAAWLSVGVVGRGRDRGRLDLRVHDLRDYADPPRRGVDDAPFGGGAGMLFRCEPIARAVAALRLPDTRTAVVLMSPVGEVFRQAGAIELSGYEQVILLADRYEGCDDRVRAVVTHELSLGDFVMSGGEIAALAVVDAVARLVPGVVGSAESVALESFSAGLLEHAQFTRPERYREASAPAVLRSGDHGAIATWQRRSAVRRTLERRPDLVSAGLLGSAELAMLRRLRAGQEAPAQTTELQGE